MKKNKYKESLTIIEYNNDNNSSSNNINANDFDISTVPYIFLTNIVKISDINKLNCLDSTIMYKVLNISNNNVDNVGYMKYFQCLKCKIFTCMYAPFCTTCLIDVLCIEVLPTNDGRGMGVFAKKKSNYNEKVIFKKGTKIVSYIGEVVTDFNSLSDNEKIYTYHNINSSFLRGVGSMINCHDSNHKSNIIYHQFNNNDFPVIIASKDIKEGEELIGKYGTSYARKMKKYNIPFPLENNISDSCL